jgi:aspartate kinase
VALAAALDADRCQILSDVDGVYSADPRIVPNARRLESITHDEMHELARHGARVLAGDAVSFARREGVTIEAAATFGHAQGTTVLPASSRERDAPPVTGVAGRSDVLWLRGRCPGGSESLAVEVSQALAPLDDLHREPDGGRPLEIVGSGENVADLEALARSVQHEFGGWVDVSTDIGSVTAVGLGLGARPGIVAATCQALRRCAVEAEAVFSGRHFVSCLVPRERVADSMRSLHASLVERHPAGTPGGAS